MATLKYAPLFPVGTPEFDETAAGLVRHTLHVCQLARAAGVKDFDVEIWNELTFGTRFLDINNYYDAAAPKAPGKQPDFLNKGGRCWELARRLAEAVGREFPEAHCIWGFSNTTFYHTAIASLPPGIAGQSYHPYGTGTRKFDGAAPRADQPPLEGFVPQYEVRLPEGFMSTFIQTEGLMRLLRPGGPTGFRHDMTEHGVLPAECGITDEAGAWEQKALCATRSFSFWLSKGVSVLHYYVAHENSPLSFGLLPADLAKLPAEATFAQVATPPMRAVRNLTKTFAGSVALEKINPLTIEVTALGEQRQVFAGDENHPPLWEREVLAAFPYELTPQKHALIFYVMTRDSTRHLAPQPYRFAIRGAHGATVTCYDPHEDAAIPCQVKRAGDALEITVPVADHPRLLTFTP